MARRWVILGLMEMRIFCVHHSAFLKDGRLTVREGRGIVIDSDPQEEYREAKVKAEAMLQTIKLAAKEEEHGSHY